MLITFVTRSLYNIYIYVYLSYLLMFQTFGDTALPSHVSRFHVLVGAMLSSQTKDEATAAAMDRLRLNGLTVEKIHGTSLSDLAAILFPVGFYNNKVRSITSASLPLHLNKYNARAAAH